LINLRQSNVPLLIPSAYPCFKRFPDQVGEDNDYYFIQWNDFPASAFHDKCTFTFNDPDLFNMHFLLQASSEGWSGQDVFVESKFVLNNLSQMPSDLTPRLPTEPSYDTFYIALVQSDSNLQSLNQFYGITSFTNALTKHKQLGFLTFEYTSQQTLLNPLWEESVISLPTLSLSCSVLTGFAESTTEMNVSIKMVLKNSDKTKPLITFEWTNGHPPITASSYFN
jgi:hypothetical protein